MKRGLYGLIFLFVLIVPLVSSIGNDLPIQIQTTDASGNIITGTFQITINISTTEDCNTVVYSNSSTRSTDNRGIIAFKLQDVDLPFDEQYYFCYYRDNVLKQNHGAGRVPYAFNSKYLGGQNASFFFPLNNSVVGNFEFNGTSKFNGKIQVGDDGSSPLAGMIRFASSMFQGYNGTEWLGLGNGSSGGSSVWVLNGLKAYYNDGNVGIGTTNPNEKLEVLGNINSTGGDICITGGNCLSTVSGGVDTNETVRFNNLVNTDCSAGRLVIGVQSNGTVLCANDNGLIYTHLSNFTNNLGFYNSTTLTTNSQLANGNNYWNSTFATFNKTYADTLYASIGSINSPVWNRSGTDVFLTNTGDNVGIGTTSPLSTLYIRAANGSGITIRTNNTNNEQVFLRTVETATDYRGSYIKEDGAANVFSLGVHNTADSNIINDTDAISIQRSTGRVGINTTNPQNTLNVRGDVNVTGNLYSNGQLVSSGVNYSNTTSTFILRTGDSVTGNYTLNSDGLNVLSSGNPLFQLRSTTTNGNASFIIGENTGATDLRGVEFFYNGVSDHIEFRDWNNSNLGLVIKRSGEVGIGTRTPNAALNVIGNVNVTGQFVGNSTFDTDVLFINANTDDVGIGTTNPTSILHIYDPSATINLEDQNAGGNYATITAGNQGQLQLSANKNNNTGIGYVSLHVNNSEFVRLTMQGWLGIGTTTPSEMLEVMGNTTIAGPNQAIVSGTDLGSYKWYANDDNSGELLEEAAGIYYVSTGTWNGANAFSRLDFGIKPDADTLPTTKMVITHDGKIGINTTTPQNTLNVIGDANITGNLSAVNGNLIVNSTRVYVGGIPSSPNGNSLSKIVVNNGYIQTIANSGEFTFFGYSDSNPNFALFSSSRNISITATGSNNHLFLNGNSGNVGIGTGTPVNTLNVVGDANVTSNLSVGGNLSIVGNVTGGTYGFGGAYANGPCDGAQIARFNNPYTGTTSCPSGFTARAMGFQSCSGGGVTSFVCTK